MKKSVVIGVAGLAVIGTLAVLTYPPVDADASSPPSIPGGVVEETDRPAVVFPQSREPDNFYYKFGPYVFPPVLRVQQPPAVEMEQPAPPPATPVEQQQYRYYCEDSKTFHPYAQTCATPWQRIIPRTPQ